MVCYYHYSYLELPVVLVDCQLEGCPSRLNHVCQGGYVILNDIDFDEAERKIFVIVLTSYGDGESQIH